MQPANKQATKLTLDELIERNERKTRLDSESILDMNTVSQAIIEAEGDLALVAERLLGNKNLQDQVLSLITSDEASISQFAAKTRAFALVKTMSMFAALGYHVMMTLPELKPAEAVKAYIQIAELMNQFTKQHTTSTNTSNSVNIFETIMGQVPAPVAEALKVIIQQQPQSQVAQHALAEAEALDAQQAPGV